MNTTRQKRVLVALSGGIDSAVSALTLRDQGYDVEGVTFMLCPGTYPCKQSAITSNDPNLLSDEAATAQSICDKLGIPHTTYDCTSVFTQQVIDRFCASYLAGRTPNPCIDCNRFVKFMVLEMLRRKRGFDYLATGHYAQHLIDDTTNRHLLACGCDPYKDQAYVLFFLTQEMLAHTLFPLGGLKKSEVRTQARLHNFPNAEADESQDICFISDNNYASFIERYTNTTSSHGPIETADGKVLGSHNGLIHYTIGQRKGLGVAAGVPLYVLAKDIARNALIVGTDEEVLCMSITVNEVNFIATDGLPHARHLSVKTHYRQTPQPATVTQTSPHTVHIQFDYPQRTCAVGQAAVFYDGILVVGGGIIAALP